jgi:hypothetical protein
MNDIAFDRCTSGAAGITHTIWTRTRYRKRRAPLDKTSFTGIKTDRPASEMFFTFYNLAAWMMHEFGQVKISPLKEGEDSASAIRTLLQNLRQLNFAVPQTFSAARLQGGSGREICGILNGLTDWALEQSSFQFQPPVHQTEGDGCVEPKHYAPSALPPVPSHFRHANTGTLN